MTRRVWTALVTLLALGMLASGYVVFEGDVLLAAADVPLDDAAGRAIQVTPSPSVPPTVTPTSSPTAPAATEAPLPTETPGPEEYVVQAGDTCYDIAYKYRHVDPDVIRVIEQLNGISCSALSVGITLLVPLPTATATPVGLDLTQTAIATSAPPMLTLDAAEYSLETYIVREGDTLTSLALLNDTSLRQLCELNPLPNGIDCGGCTWESANCCCTRRPLLRIGQQINVPAPPPTATYTPTFTGSETPTSTPTHVPPQPVYPPAGGVVTGPVRLAWLSAGVLGEREFYLVTQRDDVTGQVFTASTRQLSIDVPTAYLPNDGQAHMFSWQVSVAYLGEDGFFYPTSNVVPIQQYSWNGWE